MQIRLMGSRDLLERIKNLVDKHGKLYPNRGSDNDCRLFLNIDDHDAEQWIDLFETTDTIIEIDPQEFR